MADVKVDETDETTIPLLPLEFLPVTGGDVPDSTYGVTRLLTSDEIATLAPIFAAEGSSDLPDPATSFVVGVIVTDAGVECIVAFLVVQLRVHAEPEWIRKGYEKFHTSLIHTAERIINERIPGGCDVFLFAPAGKIARMAELAGMRMEPWVVMSKRLEGTPQAVVPEPKDSNSEERIN